MFCFLCKQQMPENIKIFTPQELKECREAASIRREQNFEYGNVQLPKDSHQGIGYHGDCLRKFLSVTRDTIGDALNDIQQALEDIDLYDVGPCCSKYANAQCRAESESTASSNTSVKSLVFED